MKGLAKQIENQSNRFINCGDNLYSELNKGGSKTLKVRISRSWISLGKFGDITVSDARSWAITIKNAIKDGFAIDEVKHLTKVSNSPTEFLASLYNQPVKQDISGRGVSLENVHKDWLKKSREEDLFSQGTARQYRNLIQSYINPALGNKELKSLTKEHFIPILALVKREKYQTYKKIMQALNGMYEFAIYIKIVDHNPLKLITKFDLPKITHIEKPSRYISLPELINVFSKLDDDVISTMVKISFLSVRRASKITTMEWKQIDLNSGVWTIIDSKNKKSHSTPLPPVGVKLLQKQHEVTGSQRYVFPNPLSKNGIHHTNVILNKLKDLSDGKQTTHGLRHAFKTWSSGAGYPQDIRSVQLEHDKEGMSRTYDHAEFLFERKIMMEHWQDLLQGKADLNEKARNDLS